MNIDRDSLKARLQDSIKHAQKSGRNFTLLFADLDNFKHINNTLGHDIGDSVIEKTKDKIRTLVGENFICRTGGDEFAIILKDVYQYKAIKKVAQNIIYSMRDAMNIDNNTIYVPISIGIQYMKRMLLVLKILFNVQILLFIKRSKKEKIIVNFMKRGYFKNFKRKVI